MGGKMKEQPSTDVEEGCAGQPKVHRQSVSGRGLWGEKLRGGKAADLQECLLDIQ